MINYWNYLKIIGVTTTPQIKFFHNLFLLTDKLPLFDARLSR